MSSRQSTGIVFASSSAPLSVLPSPTTSSNTSTAASSTTQAVTSITTTSTDSPTPVVATTSDSSTSNAGIIAGAVIGGVVFLVLVLLGILLYLRARKRKRTPPSYEFMNALKAGATPVLRLDSGAEYTPTLPEKGGGCTHHPPPVPLPFMQDSYYTSPSMQNMRFPDAMMTVTDIPSGRPSVEAPLHPQRFSSQQVNNSFISQHHPSVSVGSRKELWGSEPEIASGELSPVCQSPRDAVSHFAPRISLDEPSTQPSRSPTSLQPLRRQPD